MPNSIRELTTMDYPISLQQIEQQHQNRIDDGMATENDIVDKFSTLPKDRQQAVLGQLYEIMKPEIPDTRMRKSYFNY